MSEKVFISSEYITLGQLVKMKNLVSTGGEEKYFLANNKILVNDDIEQRRGKKLRDGDRISIADTTYLICSSKK